MAPASGKPRPMSGITFATPLSVGDYARNGDSSRTAPTIQQHTSRQQRPRTTSAPGTRPGNCAIAPPGAKQEATFIHPQASAAPTKAERRHTVAERCYRDGVQKSYQQLRQCLAVHGLLQCEGCKSGDDESRSTRVRKGHVLTAAVKAINSLRQQEKDQADLIQRLESRVRSAWVSLGEANPTDSPNLVVTGDECGRPRPAVSAHESDDSVPRLHSDLTCPSRHVDRDSEYEDDDEDLIDAIMAGFKT